MSAPAFTLEEVKRRVIAAFDRQSEVDADFFTTGEDRYDPANDPEAEPSDVASHTYGVEGYVDLDALASAILVDTSDAGASARARGEEVAK